MADVVLTERQLEVLRAVRRRPGRAGYEIAQTLRRHMNEVYDVVDELLARRLIEMGESGWRLTPEGREVLARMGGVR